MDNLDNLKRIKKTPNISAAVKMKKTRSAHQEASKQLDITLALTEKDQNWDEEP